MDGCGSGVFISSCSHAVLSVLILCFTRVSRGNYMTLADNVT